MVIVRRAKSKKSPVIMISSSCSAAMTEVQNRKGERVQKPVAVDTTYKSMNGVDCNYQHCTYYSFVQKTLKLWRKVFFYLLECSTVNSYILHQEACRQAGTKPCTALDFCRSITEDLVQEHLQQYSRPSSGRPTLGPTPIRLNRKLHLLEQHSTYRNFVCSGQTRHTTCYYCKTCSEQPAFTPPCFEGHHTLTQYRLGN